jgi:hypothetical protein
MTSSQMYWIVMLDNISTAVCVAGVLSFLALCLLTVLTLGIYSEGGHGDKWFPSVGKWLISWGISAALVVLGSYFIPGTKEMAAIVLVPKLVNVVEGNEKLMGLPDKLVNLADEWLNTLKPKNSTDDVPHANRK